MTARTRQTPPRAPSPDRALIETGKLALGLADGDGDNSGEIRNIPVVFDFTAFRLHGGGRAIRIPALPHYLNADEAHWLVVDLTAATDEMRHLQRTSLAHLIEADSEANGQKTDA